MRARKMFWGILLLSLGVLIIIQQIFHIDLPIIRILFGVLLVYLGIKIIFGSFGLSFNVFQYEPKITDSSVLFSKTTFKARENKEASLNKDYSTVFGESTLDLSDLNENDLKETIKIENAFGKTKIKTNPDFPIYAIVSVGFGSVKIRDQKINAFGEMNFKSPNYSEGKPHLKLNIDCAFGEVIVE